MIKFDEKTYTKAVDNLAEQLVAMVQEDYDEVEDQRGEAGNYLGTAVEDIQAKIEKLLN